MTRAWRADIEAPRSARGCTLPYQRPGRLASVMHWTPVSRLGHCRQPGPERPVSAVGQQLGRPTVDRTIPQVSMRSLHLPVSTQREGFLRQSENSVAVLPPTSGIWGRDFKF